MTNLVLSSCLARTPLRASDQSMPLSPSENSGWGQESPPLQLETALVRCAPPKSASDGRSLTFIPYKQYWQSIVRRSASNNLMPLPLGLPLQYSTIALDGGQLQPVIVAPSLVPR